jgi:hypothetical protein
MNAFQKFWLIIKEFGAVAYATRVPTMVVGLIVFLLGRTEPAQDMMAEAVTDAFSLTLGTAPDGAGPESFWRMRWLAILASLAVLAFTAWYWARVVLMFHRAMPDLAGNREGAYRATWRPHIVLWWPRLIGWFVFLGCAWGLKTVSGQYRDLEANADQLVWAAWVVFGLGVAFLVFLAGRRRLLAGGRATFNMPWALNGAADPRAPFLGLPEIWASKSVALARVVGNVFLLATIVLTLGSMAWAWFSPVTLGDFFGGLAIALLAGAVAIPLFTLLTIWTATMRFPWFGVAALFVVFLPTINGWLSDRIDNHDVRTVDSGKPVPPRWTIDEALKAWLDERRAANPAQERPPFIVAAAEGGASRAGYWTVLALGEMVRQDPSVRDSIFAISSVSGGSVGAVLMRALIDLDRVQEAELGWKNPDDRVVCDSGEAAPQPYLSCLRVFMRRDFLAAAFSGMFFTDLMQRVWPAAWGTFPDRAETLERSWERSWDDMIASLKLPKGADEARLKALQQKATGLFATGFAGAWGKDAKAFGDGAAIKPYPILLLNGTAVETGRRVITSNVETLTPAFPTTTRKDGQPAAVTLPCVAILTAYGRDDAAVRKKRAEECRIWEAPAVHDPFEILPGDMPVSTAINMSARFPIVEPAGGIVDRRTGKRAYHVVDGGIYENFGAQTVKDLLHFVLVARETKVRPLVVLVSTDHELDGVRQVTAAYGGTDDRAGDNADGDRLPPVERAMKLGCRATPEAGRDGVPLCDATLMRSANEVLGDAVALYRTRSGRGESAILGLREQLAQLTFYDENFFHFRQCMNGNLRPASMTWYVSPISQRFMDELLPSVNMPDPAQRSPKLSFVDWMKLAPPTPTAQSAFDDPCQNHAELKRLLNRHERIVNGKR